MNTLFRISLPLVMLMASTVANAETFNLKFNDRVFGGLASVDLVRTLQTQHRINPLELHIESVDVVVKSREGGGQVWLGSRQSQSNRQTAAGTLANFNNPADWTFSRLSFPAGNYGAGLYLNLNGNLKLREVNIRASLAHGEGEVLSNEKGDKRITLPMRHETISGLQKINLKQLLRRDAGINPDDYDLKGIEVSLKSRQGGGQVWLETAQAMSDIQTAGGIPGVFDNNNPGSYDRKYFKAPRRNNSTTPWLLGLNGEIKLNEIIVNLARR